MYTRQALHTLGVDRDCISQAQRDQLDRDGFHIVENVLAKEDVAAMRSEFERIHAEEQGQGSCEEVHVEPGARRISNIFNKTDAFDKCLWVPEDACKFPPICWARSRCMAPTCAIR